MAEPNKYVPKDIRDHILPLFPVKSLMRFKCVCKSWSSLITSPLFTRNHIEKASKQNPEIVDLKLLISLPCGFKYLDLEKSFDEKATILIRPPFWRDQYYIILGSCHGLVALLRVGNSRCLFLLWNPSTGESKELPKCNLFPLHQCHYFEFYGFGYDSSSNDYKLLINIGGELSLIFSLSKNSWRMRHEVERPLERYFSDSNTYDRGIYSNGSLYWQFKDDVIYAFDLKKEKYKYCEGPNSDSRTAGHGWNLFGVGETLYCIKEDIKKAESWIVKKYGFNGSWTKVLHIPAYVKLRNSLTNLLGFSNGNGFITEKGREIIRCDGEEGTVQKFKMCNPPCRWCQPWTWSGHPHSCDAITYVETLVSPSSLP
ncbi:hypothetical protein PTKIN_Ptkin10aG0029700 [Pterospermum kingtungense]